MRPAPRVVASRSDETATRRPVKSARCWTKKRLALMPPSTRTSSSACPVSRSCGLDEVRAPVGDALEDRAYEVRPRRSARDAEEAAARAEVPLRRAETRQRRHEGHAVGRVDRQRQRLGLVRVADQAEVVAEPFDARARREDDALDAPRELVRRALRSDDGEAARRESRHRDRVRRVPRTMSSMAPVPKVIFAPRVTHD